MPQLHQSSLQDLPEIGACHAACFPDALTVKLGKKCMEKSLEWFITQEQSFLFHTMQGQQVTGYCGGFIPGFAGDGSASGMLRYTAPDAIQALLLRPWLLLHKDVLRLFPLAAKNLIHKLLSPFSKRSRQQAVTPLYRAGAGLVVIGVHPDFRGTGVFESLIQQFEKEALQRNINDLYLSVKPSNTRAINAYTKAGWSVHKQSGAAVEMIKHIHAAHA